MTEDCMSFPMSDRTQLRHIDASCANVCGTCRLPYITCRLKILYICNSKSHENLLLLEYSIQPLKQSHRNSPQSFSSVQYGPKATTRWKTGLFDTRSCFRVWLQFFHDSAVGHFRQKNQKNLVEQELNLAKLDWYFANLTFPSRFPGFYQWSVKNKRDRFDLTHQIACILQSSRLLWPWLRYCESLMCFHVNNKLT